MMMMVMMVFDYKDDYISDGFGKYGDSSGIFVDSAILIFWS